MGCRSENALRSGQGDQHNGIGKLSRMTADDGLVHKNNMLGSDYAYLVTDIRDVLVVQEIKTFDEFVRAAIKLNQRRLISRHKTVFC